MKGDNIKMEGNNVLGELKNIYQIVHGQIVFIESKNGGLLVFNAAMITILSSSKIITYWGFKVAIIGLFISCMIGLYSFAPTSYKCKKIKAVDYWNDSLIYFRNIAKYDSRDSKIYIRHLCHSLGINEDIADSELANSYAKETIILSQIIIIKNNAFRYAQYVSVLSLLLFIFFMIVKL